MGQGDGWDETLDGKATGEALRRGEGPREWRVTGEGIFQWAEGRLQ